MPTTTASEIELMRRMAQGMLSRRMAANVDKAAFQGLSNKSVTWSIHDELTPAFASTNLSDYVMRRLGNKLYGFYYKDKGRCVAKYACSHGSALNKFKMVLITRRLKS